MTLSLFEQTLAEANLREAWLRVRANKGCAGTDGVTLDEFETNLEWNLSQLAGDVVTGKYRPRPLLRVYIEREGKKPRPLSIPCVRDRVIQTAVALVLTPIFEAEFEDCSFAYREGRSVDKAIRRVICYRDLGFRWVVDADITSYFDEIDHSLLMEEVEKLVPDKRILDLIRMWITGEIRDGDISWGPAKGVPQGSPVSPLLSNLYLDRLDEELLDENLSIVRFADDFLILCKDRDRAADALEVTEDVLETLRLKVNEKKTRIVDFDTGFRFLGVQFLRSLVFQSKYLDQGVSADAESLGAVMPKAAPDSGDSDKGAPETRSETGQVPDGFSSAITATDNIPLEDSQMVELTDKREDDAPEPPEDFEIEPSHGHEPHLRTLYIMQHGCTLNKDGERLIVKREGDVIREILARKVDQIMIFGNSTITTPVMTFCLKERIPIALLSARGNYHGMIDSHDTDAVLLHRDQFNRAEDPVFCLDVSRKIVRGKLKNSRLVLRRYARKREAPAFERAETAIGNLDRNIDAAESLDHLRGIEGAAAKAYFEAVSETLPNEWRFEGRVKRPPTDPVNAMLSYGYTLCFYNVYSLLRARGLNAHVGFLHPIRPGHPALASDLMEEFRPIVIDALVLSLIFKGRITPADFLEPQEPGRPCLLKDEARKRFIQAFETKMNSVVTHPSSGRQLDYRRCADLQVAMMAEVIRGTRGAYEPMVLR